MDLLVDQDTGDIIFENGKTLVTSCEAGSVAQRVYIHLRTFQSEWFMNLTYGVPWLQLFSKKGITKSYIDRVLQEEVYRVEGVRFDVIIVIYCYVNLLPSIGSIIYTYQSVRISTIQCKF